jgi:hypothetical protein
LTPRFLWSATCYPLIHHDILDPPYCLSKAWGHEVGALRVLLAISPVDVHRSATGPATRLHVAPTVPHHDAAPEIESEIGGGSGQHARRRLAASTAIGIVVETHIQPIERDLFLQLAMDVPDDLDIEVTAGDVGLIGDDHQGKAEYMQAMAGSCGLGVQLELFDRTRRVGPSVEHQRPVENAVTIEEHGRSDRRLSPGHPIRPERTSSTIDSSEERSA